MSKCPPVMAREALAAAGNGGSPAAVVDVMFALMLLKQLGKPMYPAQHQTHMRLLYSFQELNGACSVQCGDCDNLPGKPLPKIKVMTGTGKPTEEDRVGGLDGAAKPAAGV